MTDGATSASSNFHPHMRKSFTWSGVSLSHFILHLLCITTQCMGNFKKNGWCLLSFKDRRHNRAREHRFPMAQRHCLCTWSNRPGYRCIRNRARKISRTELRHTTAHFKIQNLIFHFRFSVAFWCKAGEIVVGAW